MLIVINLPWLATSFESTRNIFHTLISPLILTTAHEWEQFVPFLEVEMLRLGGGDGALLAKIGSGSGSLSKFYGLHITPNYSTHCLPVWGLPRGDEWLEATLLSTMPPVQVPRSWGLPSREAMTCGVGAELLSGPGRHNQQGCTMKPLGWSLGFPLCGTPLFPLLCVCTLSPSAQSVPLLEATPQSLPLAPLCSSPSPGWPSGSQPHLVEGEQARCMFQTWASATGMLLRGRTGKGQVQIRRADCRSLKGCHLAHLELASDECLIIYDSWDGPGNLWKRRNLCWNSAHMGGRGTGSLAGRHYANLGATVTAASVQGQKGAAGHTRAQAPSALKAGRGWWPALVSSLPHVKPHVGI